MKSMITKTLLALILMISVARAASDKIEKVDLLLVEIARLKRDAAQRELDDAVKDVNVKYAIQPGDRFDTEHMIIIRAPKSKVEKPAKVEGEKPAAKPVKTEVEKPVAKPAAK